MKYRLERFVLDPEGGMLTKDGQQIDTTWRALSCIAYLVEQRHRVVGYDELIRRIWGHRDATNHQLSQVVLASRRALGDDGQTQRLIRTILGHGYRWVGSVVELDDDPEPAILPLPRDHDRGTFAEREIPPACVPVADDQRLEVRADEAAVGVVALPRQTVEHVDRVEEESDSGVASFVSISQRDLSIDPTPRSVPVADPPPARIAEPPGVMPIDSAIQGAGLVDDDTSPVNLPSGADAAYKRPRHFHRTGFAAAFAAALACMPLSTGIHPGRATAAAEEDAHAVGAIVPAPLVLIEQHIWSADIEGARQAFSGLPPSVAASNDARLLAIRMEIEQGRFDRAEQRFQIELGDPRASADPLWRARLLSWQSYFRARAAHDRDAVMRPAQEAVALIEAAKVPVPSRLLGEAMSARGTGHLFMGDLDAAVKDLVTARDLLLKQADKRCATTTRHMLAHTWLRMGRLAEARDEFMDIAELSRRWKDPFAESMARNSATRIQIELLQWDEALDNSRRSIEAAEKVPNPSQSGAALRSHALVLVNIGRPEDARGFIERARDGEAPRRASVIRAMLQLATGESEEALIEAAALFANFKPSDNTNLILQNQEGALLLWMMAADDMRRAGKKMSVLLPAQTRILERPDTIPGRIAKGWWLYLDGSEDKAEVELRQALALSRSQGRLFYMTMAAEPLVHLLLDRNAIAEADEVLAMVRGQNPNLMERDYRVSRLMLRVAIAGKDRRKIEEAYAMVHAIAGRQDRRDVLRSDGKG